MGGPAWLLNHEMAERDYKHELTIKTLTGKVIVMWVDFDRIIDKLKVMLTEHTGMPAYHQRLLFAGKELMNGTLVQCLPKACTINLVLA